MVTLSIHILLKISYSNYKTHVGEKQLCVHTHCNKIRHGSLDTAVSHGMHLFLLISFLLCTYFKIIKFNFKSQVIMM